MRKEASNLNLNQPVGILAVTAASMVRNVEAERGPQISVEYYLLRVELRLQIKGHERNTCNGMSD